MSEQPSQILRVRAEYNRNGMASDSDSVTDDRMEHRSSTEFDQLLWLAQTRRRTRCEDNDMQTAK
jgi:hypothetical protein